jgi:dipeptidyl aminopeptidase/acylaminoacyl peptidase
VAFFADGKLKRVSAGGGPPETLCDAPNGRGGSWGTALNGPGAIVFAPGHYVGLSRVSAAGGEAVQVTALDSSRQEASHRYPEFLPDGRHFLYVTMGNRAESNGIFIGDTQARPDPKNVRRLMGEAAHVSYAPPGYLLFQRDDNLMAQPFDARRLEFTGEPIVIADHVAGGLSHTSDFSVSANGVLAWRTRSDAARQLVWFDRTGKQVEELDAQEQYLYPNLSPDGNRVAVNKRDAAQPGVWSIWLLDLVRGSSSRFTFGRWWANPIWSPDGRRIVFGLGSPPEYGLYWKDTSGAANEELLLKADRYLFPTDWSRDGRFLLFDEENSKTKWDIYVLPLDGDRKPVPVVETEFNERYGQFSAGGRWIAYDSANPGDTRCTCGLSPKVSRACPPANGRSRPPGAFFRDGGAMARNCFSPRPTAR